MLGVLRKAEGWASRVADGNADERTGKLEGTLSSVSLTFPLPFVPLVVTQQEVSGQESLGNRVCRVSAQSRVVRSGLGAEGQQVNRQQE